MVPSIENARATDHVTNGFKVREDVSVGHKECPSDGSRGDGFYWARFCLAQVVEPRFLLSGLRRLPRFEHSGIET